MRSGAHRGCQPAAPSPVPAAATPRLSRESNATPCAESDLAHARAMSEGNAALGGTSGTAMRQAASAYGEAAAAAGALPSAARSDAHRMRAHALLRAADHEGAAGAAAAALAAAHDDSSRLVQALTTCGCIALRAPRPVLGAVAADAETELERIGEAARHVASLVDEATARAEPEAVSAGAFLYAAVRLCEVRPWRYLGVTSA